MHLCHRPAFAAVLTWRTTALLLCKTRARAVQDKVLINFAACTRCHCISMCGVSINDAAMRATRGGPSAAHSGPAAGAGRGDAGGSARQRRRAHRAGRVRHHPGMPTCVRNTCLGSSSLVCCQVTKYQRASRLADQYRPTHCAFQVCYYPDMLTGPHNRKWARAPAWGLDICNGVAAGHMPRYSVGDLMRRVAPATQRLRLQPPEHGGYSLQ